MCSEKSMAPYNVLRASAMTISALEVREVFFDCRLNLVSTRFEMTFRSIIKTITRRRYFVDPFGLPVFCKAVSNPWPTLIYSCFAKMLLRDSAMRSCYSVGAYFRSSGGLWSYPGALLFWSLRMLLTTSSLVLGVSRGLGLPMSGSSYDSFWPIKCALNWSIMML